MDAKQNNSYWEGQILHILSHMWNLIPKTECQVCKIACVWGWASLGGGWAKGKGVCIDERGMCVACDKTVHSRLMK
jgi:hypothetical protein